MAIKLFDLVILPFMSETEMDRKKNSFISVFPKSLIILLQMFQNLVMFV